MAETLTTDPDLFFFDGLAYLLDEDYQDWVELEITRREYERDPEGFIAGCERVAGEPEARGE